MTPIPKYGNIKYKEEEIMDKKIKELTIEYNIINKIIRRLRKRKEEIFNKIDDLEKMRDV